MTWRATSVRPCNLAGTDGDVGRGPDGAGGDSDVGCGGGGRVGGVRRRRPGGGGGGSGGGGSTRRVCAPGPAPTATTPPGRAVQVGPIKPTLKAPGTERLKPTYDRLLSNFAFKLNLRRYTLALVPHMPHGMLLDPAAWGAIAATSKAE